MLERYGRVAQRIYPFRKLLYAGIAVGLAVFMCALLTATEDAQETRMFLPLVAVLWCVCLAMFAHGFSGGFPVAQSDDGWFLRLRIATVRAFWHLVAVAVIALGLATLALTVRAVVMFGA